MRGIKTIHFEKKGKLFQQFSFMSLIIIQTGKGPKNFTLHFPTYSGITWFLTSKSLLIKFPYQT